MCGKSMSLTPYTSTSVPLFTQIQRYSDLIGKRSSFPGNPVISAWEQKLPQKKSSTPGWGSIWRFLKDELPHLLLQCNSCSMHYIMVHKLAKAWKLKHTQTHTDMGAKNVPKMSTILCSRTAHIGYPWLMATF